MKFRWIRYIAERLPKEIRERRKTEIEACFTGTKKQLEEKVMESTFDSSEILKEIKEFPRYFINKKGEVYHEAGLPILPKFENKVELFDASNNKVLVDVNELIKSNF